MNKIFHVNTEYDSDLDIFTISVVGDFNFKKSLELEDGVILDFDENNIPISIEILDISQRLNIRKQEINSSKIV